MPKKYTKEQLWKLYEKLPQELKDALFAEETGDYIYQICQKNKIGNKTANITDYVGHVLIGVLPPEDFQENLEKELKIKRDVAKKVAQEINRFVFYPVRPILEQLYKIGIRPSEKPVEKTTEKPIEEPKLKEEEPKTPPSKDVYREPIE